MTRELVIPFFHIFAIAKLWHFVLLAVPVTFNLKFTKVKSSDGHTFN